MVHISYVLGAVLCESDRSTKMAQAWSLMWQFHCKRLSALGRREDRVWVALLSDCSADARGFTPRDSGDANDGSPTESPNHTQTRAATVRPSPHACGKVCILGFSPFVSSVFLHFSPLFLTPVSLPLSLSQSIHPSIHPHHHDFHPQLPQRDRNPAGTTHHSPPQTHTCIQ